MALQRGFPINVTCGHHYMMALGKRLWSKREEKPPLMVSRDSSQTDKEQETIPVLVNLIYPMSFVFFLCRRYLSLPSFSYPMKNNYGWSPGSLYYPLEQNQSKKKNWQKHISKTILYRFILSFIFACLVVEIKWLMSSFPLISGR